MARLPATRAELLLTDVDTLRLLATLDALVAWGEVVIIDGVVAVATNKGE